MTTITWMSINLQSGGLDLTPSDLTPTSAPTCSPPSGTSHTTSSDATASRTLSTPPAPPSPHKAFTRLPKRWQAVLWHTEVEGETQRCRADPGLSPNGVSALAYRAREGLRQAYLQIRLTEAANQHRRCRAATEKLGVWTKGGLGRREKAQVQTHVDECDSCRRRATELQQVNEVMDRCA